MPNLWRIWYTAGFPTGQIPNDIVAAVGKMACFYPLNVAGDLLWGSGVTSKSLGIDGLSQSINTPRSGDNSAFGARLKTYERELKESIIPYLVNFYKGFKLVAC
jgi:hypothetical protein